MTDGLDNGSFAKAPEKAPRPSWDEYFMEIARVTSRRATCPRKSVGAVIVRDCNVIATGYNGSLRGLPHCADVGCAMEDGHCTRVVHSEQNAIFQAAKMGHRLDGATLYVTASPCWLCFRAIVQSGVKRVVFAEFYRDERIFEAAMAARVELHQLGG